MPSIQVTLVANTVSLVPLDAPTTRIVITQEAGTAAEIYGTADGSLPVVPTNGVEITNEQFTVPAFEPLQTVVAPPLSGGFMTIPTLRLISAGTPTVLVQW